MSVECYLVCHKHKEYVWTCSDGFSGPMLQCGWEAAGFMIQHQVCDLSILDEHDIEEFEDTYIEWDKKNWKQKMTYEHEEK